MRQSHHLIRNALFNLLGQLAGVISVFIIPPFVIGHIGIDNWGLLFVVASVLQFAALVQMGTPKALTRFVSQEVGREDSGGLSRILSTGLAILVASGVVILAMLLVALVRPEWVLDLPEGMSVHTVRWVLVIMGIAFALTVPLSLGNVAFYATERFGLLSALQGSGVVFRVVLIIATLSVFNHSLIAFVTASAISNVTLAVVTFVCGLCLLREGRIGWRYIRKDNFKQIMGYGIEVFINSFAYMLFVQADAILINKIPGLGAAAAGIFSLPFTWSFQMRVILAKIVSVAVPFSAGKQVNSDLDTLRIMLIRITKYALTGSILVLVFLYVFRYQAMSIWLKEKGNELWQDRPIYEMAAYLLPFFLVSDFFANASTAGYQIFLGIGRMRFLTVTNLILGPVNIVMVIVLAHYCQLGLTGVAISYLAVFVVGPGIIMPICMARILGLSPIRYYQQSYLGPVLACLALIPVAYWVRNLIAPGNWGELCLAAAIVTAAYIPLAYVLAMDSYDRKVVKDFLNRAAARFRNPPSA